MQIEIEQPRRSVRAGRLFADGRRGFYVCSTIPRQATVCTKMPFVHFVATVGNVETVLSLLSLQSWKSLQPWVSLVCVEP